MSNSRSSRYRTTIVLFELGLLFLPAIPAYLWMWPAARRYSVLDEVNGIVYLYILAGTLVIGLRRWTPGELGLVRQGVCRGLVLGFVLCVERLLAQPILHLPIQWQNLSFWQWVWEIFFYFALVGFVEELLFRGLIYRWLFDWRGAVWAVLGQALAFGLWHVGWAGPLALAHVFIGLLFGLARWHAGGIWGLVLSHGLFDVFWVAMLPKPDLQLFLHGLSLDLNNRLILVLGDLVLLTWVIWLWRTRPRGTPAI